MSLIVHVLYPEQHWVSEEQIRVWASDSLANERNEIVDPESLELHAAIEILYDLSEVSIGKIYDTSAQEYLSVEDLIEPW